jgi:hypothetical protein
MGVRNGRSPAEKPHAGTVLHQTLRPSKKGCLFSRDASSLGLKGAEDRISRLERRLHVEAAMASRGSRRSREHCGAAPVVRDGETPIVALRDDDLLSVTGGLLASAVSNALKTLGEGLSTMARKG